VALTFDRLSLALSGRPVLSAVSADLAPGRVTVVLGANGAGKSSLVRAAAALVRPSSGQVLLDGRDVATIAPRERARAIGYLPQDAAVHWNMQVGDLVALGRLPHRAGAAADRAAIEDALDATATHDLRDRRVRELSGGERARVLLARVLAGEPRWLLADEPLASLDPAHQLDALAMFRAIAARGTGVVVVLHDLIQAARIADDAILLKDGALLSAGPRDVILTPANLGRAFDIRVTLVDGAAGPIIVPVGRST
jgi:iron complex transport system ATP-binding protein